MKTVGQILKKNRLEKGIELEQISKQTRIQPKYLEALENDDYGTLPSGTTARGFIKNYGSALGMSSVMLLALFRRDFTENKAGQVIPRGVVKPLSAEGFAWNPRHTIAAAVTIILLALAAYLHHEYQILVGPPKLTIENPKQNAEVRGDQVEIIGQADSDTQVWVNGEEIEVSPDGSFRYQLSLPAGENTFSVEAANSRGKTNKIWRTVQVVP